MHAVARSLAGTAREVAWRERVWTAIYEQGRDPGDATTVEALATDFALEIDEIVSNPDGDGLIAATEDARALGVTGVPTFMLDRWPFGGVQEEATLRSLFQRFVRKKLRDATDARSPG